MPSRNVGGGRGASTFSYRASLNSTVICRLSRNARGRRHPATQNNIKETTSSAYIVADASDLFVVRLRSNSKAAIPQATVGTAAPTTNIRTETNTAWVTCARTTASSLEMAAAISATQARNPITLRAIRAVINRCPIVDTPYREAPALPDGALHIRSPSSAQAGRVSWRSRDLITR